MCKRTFINLYIFDTMNGELNESKSIPTKQFHSIQLGKCPQYTLTLLSLTFPIAKNTRYLGITFN